MSGLNPDMNLQEKQHVSGKKQIKIMLKNNASKSCITEHTL